MSPLVYNVTSRGLHKQAASAHELQAKSKTQEPRDTVLVFNSAIDLFDKR